MKHILKRTKWAQSQGRVGICACGEHWPCVKAELGKGMERAIAVLEALRDRIQEDDWVDLNSKRSVLYGIKMAIATLKATPPEAEIRDHIYSDCPNPWECEYHKAFVGSNETP